MTHSSVAAPNPAIVPEPQRKASTEQGCAVARPKLSLKVAENEVVAALAAGTSASAARWPRSKSRRMRTFPFRFSPEVLAADAIASFRTCQDVRPPADALYMRNSFYVRLDLEWLGLRTLPPGTR